MTESSPVTLVADPPPLLGLLIGAARRVLRRAGARLPPVRLQVEGGFVGAGYGRPSTAGSQAADAVAQAESVRLDPTYGAKAMAALWAAGERGELRNRPAAFWLTIQQANPCAS